MKILVVNINWLGDAIFSTPVFKALKDKYPHAQVVCLCPPRVKDVLTYCPYVDKIIIYDEKKKHFWPWKKLKFILQLRQEKFDSAVLIHRSLTRALLVWLAGIPVRVGFSKARFLLTTPVDFPSDHLHRADGYLKVVEGLGVTPQQAVCQLRLKNEDIDAVEELLRREHLVEGKYIVFHPSGNWDLKRWPQASWVALGNQLRTQFGLTVVITGGDGDINLCQSIAKEIQGAKVLAGQTRLGESLVIFRKSVAVISGDSGPLHMANSVGAAVIGLFGPTSPAITGVKGVGPSVMIFHQVGCNHQPCYHLDCRNNVCMTTINIEDVCRELEQFIHP